MVTGFLGQFDYQLDGKGRVSLPAEYRRLADTPHFVLLQWEPTHLTLFPDNEWVAVEERILELRRERRKLAPQLRELLARACPVKLDSQGRILIPQWLKERVNLDGAVKVVGQGDRIEFWNPVVFTKEQPGTQPIDSETVDALHDVLG